MFKDKAALVTGGAKVIGKRISDEFRRNGAIFCGIGKAEGAISSGIFLQM